MKYIIKYNLRGDANDKRGYESINSETDLTVKEIKYYLKTKLKIDETYTVETEKLELTSYDAEIIDSSILSGRSSQNLEYKIQIKKK